MHKTLYNIPADNVPPPLHLPADAHGYQAYTSANKVTLPAVFVLSVC